MKGFLKLINNWKSIIGYAVLSAPWINDYPMLRRSIEDVLANPSRETISFLIGQLVLALGIAHRVIKNVKEKK